MRRLIVTTFWEKVDESVNLGTPLAPFYKVLRGQYEVKSRVSYPEKRSVRELVKDARRSRRFNGWVRNGFRTRTESAYGIRSYQTVTIEEGPA